MVQGANLWVNQHNIPANKIVLGIPAFGVRYDQLDENGNNASWGSYAYMRYNDILAEDPDAATQEYSDIALECITTESRLSKKKQRTSGTTSFSEPIYGPAITMLQERIRLQALCTTSLIKTL